MMGDLFQISPSDSWETMASSSSKSKGKRRERRAHFESSPPEPSARYRSRTATPLRSALKNSAPVTPQKSAAPTTASEASETSETAPAPKPNIHPIVQPINTNINPAFGFNPTFTHSVHTGLGIGPGVAPGFLSNIQGGYQGFQNTAPQLYCQPQPVLTQLSAPYHATTMSSGYVPPINIGMNYQPQVPDTTNGPNIHTYVPRQDANSGVIYVQAATPYGYTTPNGGVNVYVHGAQGAPAGGLATVTGPVAPVVIQQAPQPHGMMASGQPVVAGGGYHQIPPPGANTGMYHQMPVNYGVFPEPATGIGRTPGETLLDQVQFAHANNMYEPQDFKPGDDDPSRHYFVRELDGNWTQRSRISIDTMGDCRWYMTDNAVFYAVRLPN